MDEGLDLSWGFVPIPPEGGRPTVSELDFGGLLARPLLVEQDGGAHGCGGHLWPAGELLSRYLIRQTPFPFHKIIEIGSGMGLAGLALARGKPEDLELYLTDQENMLDLMNANIRLNGETDRVQARVLNWGEPLPAFCRGVDLVLAADCAYLEGAFPLLEQTLLDLTENSDVPILLSYKRRRAADRKFFRAMAKNFTIEELTDYPEFPEFHKQRLFLFELRRKAHESQPI